MSGKLYIDRNVRPQLLYPIIYEYIPYLYNIISVPLCFAFFYFKNKTKIIIYLFHSSSFYKNKLTIFRKKGNTIKHKKIINTTRRLCLFEVIHKTHCRSMTVLRSKPLWAYPARDSCRTIKTCIYDR